MSTSRPESQAPQFGRRRSNTAQSLYKNTPLSATPLKFGDSKTLTTWVHDTRESPNVILNRAWWPGVVEGDMIRVSTSTSDGASGFLFNVQKDEERKYQLQISVPKPIAEQFGVRNNGEVTLTKIDKAEFSADYVELTFQDQYLGRNEMWRLSSHLVGQCVYVEQEISFIGVIGAKVNAIYINGSKVPAAYVTSSTKAVYRSLSARVTIFIQVCRELWEFAGDGERYNEKIVHSLLPTLFSKWRDANTNHIVTIVLISRVFYDPLELDDAAGPLRQNDEGRWYKDFYKVITDLEVLHDWKPTLVDLKDSFWAFQRDILLAHHYHRSSLASASQPEPDHVRLVGSLSYAHDGPLLEALNLGLNPTETHYIDRSLSLTGSSTIVITPGTGFFRVSKQLLRLTTTRLLDQGFAVELISLTKPPLHQSPVFSFQGMEPMVRAEGQQGKSDYRSLDPLWGADEASTDTLPRDKTTFWWEPFWMMISFWDKQMDLPFRDDRFVARAKMHEIEMLGLLDHDVLSNIEIPFLSELNATSFRSVPPTVAGIPEEAADAFDMDVFSVKPERKSSAHSRNSFASSGGGPPSGVSSRLSESLKRSSSTRTSETSMFSVIEESPRRSALDISAEGSSSETEIKFLNAAHGVLSTSPSQSSMRSIRSARSQASTISVRSSRSHQPRSVKGSTSSQNTMSKTRFTPAWLFNPFKSTPSQPETSTVSSISDLLIKSSTLSSAVSPTTVTVSSTPEPRSTKQNIVETEPIRLNDTRHKDEEKTVSHNASLRQRSSTDIPPRDDVPFPGRRALSKTSSMTLPAPAPVPMFRTNPSKTSSFVPYTQSSLARRWQHMFPLPLSKHEIKWRAMVMPGCLPLTTEHFPTTSELETAYDFSQYDSAIETSEMRSFLVRPPASSGSADEIRRSWARVVMRSMVALRLAQGFQFVSRSSKPIPDDANMLNALRRSRSYVTEDETSPKPVGVAEVLKSTDDPIYLSMSNEIHRIAYGADSVQVRRYVRRMPRTQPYKYQCLIWPKLGLGYTELSTSFATHGFESYGWNRLDMLVAGYELQFNESIRYWRTRFVVIPTDIEQPLANIGPLGENLNDEEVRLAGIDKLAELFTKARWCPPEDRGKPGPPVRFLTTDLEPAACVLDESLMAQLDDIHASGPLRKKPKSEKAIADMSLPAIAKAMREDDGIPIKENRWHGNKYSNSFIGSDFVSWLVREFRDVSSREQGVEWGVKLQEKCLFQHCRGTHGFLDGHYFYSLSSEYLIPMTPRTGWFRATRHVSVEEPGAKSADRLSITSRKTNKRLILSQSMVIDVDPNKRSDQAESVILHHDIIHNPATCFHFELQWIGTTARCIDDLLRQWSRTIERYGLKLVEGYVAQICDIRDRNPFQSCFPLPLAAPPPIIPNLDQRVAEGVQTRHYFEYAILRKHGFVLDIEAAALYPDPEQVDVVYSYRRAPFKYSQWVHRSGVAFAQVLGGSDGFLFLTNRLMAPGRIGTSTKFQRPAAVAEEIRIRMQKFCSDKECLTRFYDEETAQLKNVPEEPPPLHI